MGRVSWAGWRHEIRQFVGDHKFALLQGSFVERKLEEKGVRLLRGVSLSRSKRSLCFHSD